MAGKLHRLAIVAATTAAGVVGVVTPASAAAFTNVSWSLSQPQPGSTAVRYTWSFTTATTGTVASVTFTVPSGTTGAALTPVDVYGVSAGTAALNTGTNTVTYTVTTPASIASGTSVLISIDGFTNTATAGTYASAETTLTAGAATIDTGNSNSVGINTSTTAVTVVVARSTSFSSDTTGFNMLMDPSVAALTDQTKVVNLAIATNAAHGYTLTTKLDQQLTGSTNATSTFTAISAGVATGVASGSFPSNRFGYTETGTGVGTVTGAGFATGYVGYTTAGEVSFTATGPTNADTVALTNRAKINYLQPADTYLGTITYTVTPSY